MHKLSHPHERLQWIIDEYYEGHPFRLANVLGVSPATITHIVNKGNKGAYPSWKFTAALLLVHKDLSPDWWIHGVGAKRRVEEPWNNKMVDIGKVKHLTKNLYEVLYH